MNGSLPKSGQSRHTVRASENVSVIPLSGNKIRQARGTNITLPLIFLALGGYKR